MSPQAAPEDETPTDGGFTLIELLVAIGIFSVLGTLLLGFALTTSGVTRDVQDAADVTSESRLATERMSRELRQAREIDAVQFAAGTTGSTAITFWTDFDGDGLRDMSASDPEVLTYRWEPATRRLTLTADDASGGAVTRPVLAGTITSFTLDLRSSLWQYDGRGASPANGVVDWRELDASGAPVGNRNGRPDGPELTHIDLVAISMTVREGDSEQTFTMQTDLRNMAQT